jgi:hypothetical protein
MKWPWTKKQQKVNLVVMELVSWYSKGFPIFDGRIVNITYSSEETLQIEVVSEAKLQEKYHINEYKRGRGR